jgi:hypothetical protein
MPCSLDRISKDLENLVNQQQIEKADLKYLGTVTTNMHYLDVYNVFNTKVINTITFCWDRK